MVADTAPTSRLIAERNHIQELGDDHHQGLRKGCERFLSFGQGGNLVRRTYSISTNIIFSNFAFYRKILIEENPRKSRQRYRLKVILLRLQKKIR